MPCILFAFSFDAYLHSTNRYGRDGCAYLLEIDAHINDMSRLVEGQSPYVIDATNYGNVSRYINHR